MELKFEQMEQVEEYGNGKEFLLGIFGGIAAAAAFCGLFFT